MKKILPKKIIELVANFNKGQMSENSLFESLHEDAHAPAKNRPEILLDVADQLFPTHPDTAVNLIYTAIAERELDKKPEIILASAARILRQHGRSDYAEVVYKGVIKLNPDNMYFCGQLGDLYIEQSKPETAIALLKPIHDSGSGNTVTASTLGNAYSITSDQKGFDAIKDQITPADLRDYLEAKLWYFKKDEHGSNSYTKKALRIVSPYMAQDINNAPMNIVKIYMACIGDDSPILSHLKATVGEAKFAKLIERRDSWRADPLRAERENHHMSSSQAMWRDGAIPASGADRSKAGLDWENDGAPVYVKRRGRAEPTPH